MAEHLQTRSERLRLASRERREHQKHELREAILTAAADLILEHGYDHFSLRQVAERIGYSPTTIYLHFQNKDDLLFQVVSEGFRLFSERFLEVSHGAQGPLERLAEMSRVYVQFGFENPAYYQLMFSRRPDFLVHEQPQTPGKPIDLFQVLCDTVQEAIDAGLFRPGNAESFSDAMWTCVHGVVTLTCTEMFDEERRNRAVETALSMVFDGLRAR